MSDLSSHGKAKEARYHHDTALAFKTNIRRNKLIGEWAADLLGLEGADAQAYIQSLIDMDVDGKKDQDLIAKIHEDMQAQDIDKSEHRITKQLNEFCAQARKELMEGE